MKLFAAIFFFFLFSHSFSAFSKLPIDFIHQKIEKTRFEPRELEQWIKAYQTQLSANLSDFSVSEVDIVIVGAGIHALFLIEHLCQSSQKPSNLHRCLIIEESHTHSPLFQKGFWLNSPSLPQKDTNSFGSSFPFQPKEFSPFPSIPSHGLWGSLVLNYVSLEHPIHYQTQIKSVTLDQNQKLLINLKQKGTSSTIQSKTLVLSTGLGKLNPILSISHPLIWSSEEFLTKSFQKTLPFPPSTQVAVIGGGDSGKSIIERLIGASPYNLKEPEESHPSSHVFWFTGKTIPNFRKEIFGFLKSLFPFSLEEKFQKIQKIPHYLTQIEMNNQKAILHWDQQKTSVDLVVNATGFKKFKLDPFFEKSCKLKRKVIQELGSKCAQSLIKEESEENLPIFFVGGAVDCYLQSPDQIQHSITKNEVSIENLQTPTRKFAQFLQKFLNGY
jgi:hypothetical protein